MKRIKKFMEVREFAEDVKKYRKEGLRIMAICRQMGNADPEEVDKVIELLEADEERDMNEVAKVLYEYVYGEAYSRPEVGELYKQVGGKEELMKYLSGVIQMIRTLPKAGVTFEEIARHECIKPDTVNFLYKIYRNNCGMKDTEIAEIVLDMFSVYEEQYYNILEGCFFSGTAYMLISRHTVEKDMWRKVAFLLLTNGVEDLAGKIPNKYGTEFQEDWEKGKFKEEAEAGIRASKQREIAFTLHYVATGEFPVDIDLCKNDINFEEYCQHIKEIQENVKGLYDDCLTDVQWKQLEIVLQEYKSMMEESDETRESNGKI